MQSLRMGTDHLLGGQHAIADCWPFPRLTYAISASSWTRPPSCHRGCKCNFKAFHTLIENPSLTVSGTRMRIVSP